MRYIKKFNESDMWAGSSLAYNTIQRRERERTIQPRDSENLPVLVKYPYKCNDCGVEFDSFDPNQDWCKGCESSNIEKISITYEN